MIQFKSGVDIFNYLDRHPTIDAVCNTVNCVGVMGTGIALEMSKRFPHIVKPYKDLCRLGVFSPGDVFVSKSSPIILNVFTKDHWKNPSQYRWVYRACNELRVKIEQFQLTTTLIPALGCGNGGLSWIVVETILKRVMHDIKSNIIVFGPHQ